MRKCLIIPYAESEGGKELDLQIAATDIAPVKSLDSDASQRTVYLLRTLDGGTRGRSELGPGRG